MQCTAPVFCITSVESHDTASTEVHGCNVCRRYKFVVSSLLVYEAGAAAGADGPAVQAKYQQALQAGLSQDSQADAAFGLVGDASSVVSESVCCCSCYC